MIRLIDLDIYDKYVFLINFLISIMEEKTLETGHLHTVHYYISMSEAKSGRDTDAPQVSFWPER